MNWLDIVIICLMAVGILKGFCDGFIRQIAALAALIAAIYFCSKGAIILSAFLIKTAWFNEYSLTVVSYLLAFILILSTVLFVGQLVHGLLKATPLHFFNKLLGSTFALIATLLLLSFSLNLFEVVDRNSLIITNKTKKESKFYTIVKEIIPSIYPSNLFVWKK